MGGAIAVALALALIPVLLVLLLLLELLCSLRRRSDGLHIPVSPTATRSSPAVESPPLPPSPVKPVAGFPFYAHGVLRAPTEFLLSVPQLEAAAAAAIPPEHSGGLFVCISNPVYDEGASPSCFSQAAREEDGERSPPLRLMKKLPPATARAAAAAAVEGQRSLATSASATETNRGSFSSDSLCSSPSW